MFIKVGETKTRGNNRMNITQNVFKLECTKGVYAYAVKDSDGVTLIDTCAPGRGAAILKELGSNGTRPQDIKLLHTLPDGKLGSIELYPRPDIRRGMCAFALKLFCSWATWCVAGVMCLWIHQIYLCSTKHKMRRQ